MLSRRQFLAQTSLATSSLLLPQTLCAAAPERFASLPAGFAELEKKNGGRLGVYVWDTGSGEHSGYRTEERFPMCSTFKFALGAIILHRVDGQKESLLRQVDVPAKVTIEASPITKQHEGGSMTVNDLCAALLTRSDNTAANLLLETIGGPAAYTAAMRALGDTVTRLDRNEPTLNTSLAGDPRDTTTPFATAQDLNQIVLGKALTPASRAQITEWMEGCQTGLNRLRKGIPQGWRVADRTGSNGEHTTNTIAVVFPPAGKAPLIVTAYITQCQGPESKRDAMLAEVGRMVSAAAV